MAATKISKKFITVNGKRVGVRYSVGPWISTVSPDLIKIRSRTGSFPAEFHDAFAIENDSDSREGYFVPSHIRILPDHPLYADVKAAAFA